MLDLAIPLKGAGDWLLPLGQQPAQSDITLSGWPCCGHCTGSLPEFLKKNHPELLTLSF